MADPFLNILSIKFGKIELNHYLCNQVLEFILSGGASMIFEGKI